MNKKINTLIFLVAGTAVNILLMLLFLFVFLSLAALGLRRTESQGLVTVVYIGCILGSIAGSFFVYSRLIRWVNKKMKLDNYITPFFGRRQR